MYINYVNDRKQLKYQALKDTACGIETVKIINSMVPNFSNIDYETSWIFIYPSEIKGQVKKTIVIIIIFTTVHFTPLKPAEAIGLSVTPTPVVRIQPNYRHSSEVKNAPTVRPHT